MTVVQPMPPGTTVDDIAARLRFQMGRYPTLRTRVLTGPEGPHQVVAEAGETTLEIVDAEAGEDDPAKVAEEVAARLRDTALDPAAEWPLRMAAVRQAGQVTHQVAVVSRLVTDAAGGAIVAADLAGFDPRRTPPGASGIAPEPGMTPLEQAGWQRSPAGRRHNRHALRHWEKVLRAVPAGRFGAGHGEVGHPRYWRARFSSPALRLALPTIAARTASAGAPVLLAVYAVALARVTGVHPVLARVVVNNRFRPEIGRSVCPLAQTGPFLLDVASTTVEEVVRRARRGSFATYKYAYHDAEQLYALVERLSRERGEQIQIGCFLDDRRWAGQTGFEPAPEAPVPAERIRAARRATVLEWTGGQDQPLEALFLHVDNGPGTVDLSVQVDTRQLSRGRVEEFLLGFEAVAVAAAADPAVPTGVPAGAAAGGDR